MAEKQVVNFLASNLGGAAVTLFSVAGMKSGLPAVLNGSGYALLVLLIYGFNRNLTKSALIVAAVIVTYNLATGKGPLELFSDLYAPTVVPLHCHNVKYADILRHYKMDESALLDDLVRAGTPRNIRLNDENAPLLATYLHNIGVNPC
jgi:hypothetical protein